MCFSRISLMQDFLPGRAGRFQAQLPTGGDDGEQAAQAGSALRLGWAFALGGHDDTKSGLPKKSRRIGGEEEMTEQHFGKAYAGSPPENYERFFVPSIGEPLAIDLVNLAALRPGERVLDVACGTGVVARLASEQVGDTGTVAGLDLNPGMLAVARTATPPGMRIEWHEASAEAMPMPDASFDVVLCQMGLQFVPDKSAALQEIRRVLAPGGRLLFNVPGPTPPLFKVMGEALARQMGAEAAGFVDHVFSLHDAAEIQELVAGAGFHDVSVAADTKLLRLPPPEEFLWQYVHSTPLAGAVAHVEDDRRRLLERDVVAGWREFVNDSSLDLLVRSVVATARK
jgi:SAM-dependent methyltransferase